MTSGSSTFKNKIRPCENCGTPVTGLSHIYCGVECKKLANSRRDRQISVSQEMSYMIFFSSMPMELGGYATGARFDWIDFSIAIEAGAFDPGTIIKNTKTKSCWLITMPGQYIKAKSLRLLQQKSPAVWRSSFAN